MGIAQGVIWRNMCRRKRYNITVLQSHSITRDTNTQCYNTLGSIRERVNCSGGNMRKYERDV